MGRKLRDDLYFGGSLRNRRDQARKKMGEALGQNSMTCRRIFRKSKEEGMRVGKLCNMKNVRKLNVVASMV